MLDVAPSKDFVEKMKASHAKPKGKFGRKKKKAGMRKGLAMFGKKQEMDDKEEGE